MRRSQMMKPIREQGERYHQELRRRINRAHELAQQGMREAEAELARVPPEEDEARRRSLELVPADQA